MPNHDLVSRAVMSLVLASAFLAGGCGSSVAPTQAPASVPATPVISAPPSVRPSTPSPNASSPQPSADPAGTVWLCKPGVVDDPCAGSLDTTVIDNSGTMSVERLQAASNPPIDCFFVYPTASNEPGLNADLRIDADLKNSAIREGALFSQVCAVYAPVYRQLTGLGLDQGTAANVDVAYQDARSAFADYIANYNHGRGIVFIGHSQGSAVLTELVSKVVDPDPALRALLVSAILLGSNVMVPQGKTVGGDLANIGPCKSPKQTGCVVAYSSFEYTPPPDAPYSRPLGSWRMFPMPQVGPRDILCVNPAALGGGPGVLMPYWKTTDLARFPAAVKPTPPTEYITFPDQLTAECKSDGDGIWLQITRETPNVLPIFVGSEGLGFGLHDFDTALAMGNLVDLVRSEAAAWR